MTENNEMGGRPFGAGAPSQQVSWWETHQFIEHLRAQLNCGPIPVAGTPEWQQLDHRDQRKLLALADAGQHHVLRVEVAQEAAAQASKAIAAAADWTAVARSIRGHRAANIIPRRRN